MNFLYLGLHSRSTEFLRAIKFQFYDFQQVK